jgi:hypothetical protein
MTINRLKVGLAAAAAAAFVCTAPIEASATHKLGHDVAVGVGAGIGVGIGLGILGAVTQPRPVYQQPRPVYVQPQPVYQKPRRVVQPVYEEEEVCYKRRVWEPDGYGGRVQVIRLVCE